VTAVEPNGRWSVIGCSAPEYEDVTKTDLPERSCHTGRREHRPGRQWGYGFDPWPGRMPLEDDPEAGSDAVLLERTSVGDHQAYAELVRRYSAIAHRTATLIAGPADAEDAVQEAFVRAFYALGRFRQGSPFKPWLLAIVANSARNKARSYGQQSRLRERLMGAPAIAPLRLVPSAESVVLEEDDRRGLVNAIDALPANARLVVTCRYLLELSEAETAQVLGWPVGTVKSRLSRALDRLRDILAENGGDR
jgi:RNA polymerase sigma factor (sigma-70 family)